MSDNGDCARYPTDHVHGAAWCPDSHDDNDKLVRLGGPPVDRLVDINTKAMSDFMTQFGAWTKHVWELEKPNTGGQKASDSHINRVPIKCGPGGLPVLPSPKPGLNRKESVSMQQRLIRDFVAAHYGK